LNALTRILSVICGSFYLSLAVWWGEVGEHGLAVLSAILSLMWWLLPDFTKWVNSKHS